MSYNFIITGILNPAVFNWFFSVFTYAGLIMQTYSKLVQFNLYYRVCILPGVYITRYIPKIHTEKISSLQRKKPIALLFITCKTRRSIPYVRVKKKSSHNLFSKNYLLNAQKSIACGIAPSKMDCQKPQLSLVITCKKARRSFMKTLNSFLTATARLKFCL